MSTMIYCLGIPLCAWGVSSWARHSKGAWLKPRVGLLLASYQDHYHWFEAVDLLRKFFLTCVVLRVSPGTKVQLWFGSLVAVVSALVYQRLSPYRSELCQKLQLVVQLQIVFTYLAANVFYRELLRLELGSL